MTTLKVRDLHNDKRILPDSLIGRTSLIFLSNKQKHRKMFSELERMWNARFGSNSPTHTLYSIACITNPLFKTGPVMKYTMKRMRKGTPRDQWGIRTMRSFNNRKLRTWLETNGLPTTLRGTNTGTNMQNAQTTRDTKRRKKAMRRQRKTLSSPVLVLIDGEGTIRRALLGLKRKDFSKQRSTIQELINDAASLTSKPMNSNMAQGYVPNGVGIGAQPAPNYMG